MTEKNFWRGEFLTLADIKWEFLPEDTRQRSGCFHLKKEEVARFRTTSSPGVVLII